MSPEEQAIRHGYAAGKFVFGLSRDGRNERPFTDGDMVEVERTVGTCRYYFCAADDLIWPRLTDWMKGKIVLAGDRTAMICESVCAGKGAFVLKFSQSMCGPWGYLMLYELSIDPVNCDRNPKSKERQFYLEQLNFIQGVSDSIELGAFRKWFNECSLPFKK